MLPPVNIYTNTSQSNVDTSNSRSESKVIDDNDENDWIRDRNDSAGQRALQKLKEELKIKCIKLYWKKQERKKAKLQLLHESIDQSISNKTNESDEDFFI